MMKDVATNGPKLDIALAPSLISTFPVVACTLSGEYYVSFTADDLLGLPGSPRQS